MHRDFCEIAIAEGGGVRAAGRVATDRETLELFARSLCDATDAPASIPPAPWRSRVSALLWWQWPTPAARAALPQQLASRAGLPITIGGLIAYHEGPVGPYNEVVGSPVLLRRGPLVCHVPFLAVDSAASAAAGRGNWALPKVLASFEFDAGPGPVRAIGDGWELVVAATVRARRFPFAMTVRCVQEWPDGRLREAPAQMRARRSSHASTCVTAGRRSSASGSSTGATRAF